MPQHTVTLTGCDLTPQQLHQVTVGLAQVAISPQARRKVLESRELIIKKVEAGEILYGITTGFGINADKAIPRPEVAELQRNLIISHACGTGRPFPTETVRAIMLIRLNTLLKGHSGMRMALAERLCDFLNNRIHPHIPEQGSVGASGDLCPLAHMAAALIGEGKAEINGKLLEGEKLRQTLSEMGLPPLTLLHKEGVALINGTAVMNALGILAVRKARQLLRLATLASALAAEAMGARTDAYDPKPHHIRLHKGQEKIARWMRRSLARSGLAGISTSGVLRRLPNGVVAALPRHLQDNLSAVFRNKAKLDASILKHTPDEWAGLLLFALKKNIPQDAYSIRCVPQILGASSHAIKHASKVFAKELNAVTDNPLVFAEEGEIISAGNFHGQPLALALDYLKLAIAEMGNLLERQMAKLTDPNHNHGLPAMLAVNTGLHSGMMIPQYVAASLVSENKVLVHPASADSIPTCANQEDHVSMGTIAGRQAVEMAGNVEKIAALALLTSAQALDLRQMQFTNRGIDAPMPGKLTTQLQRKIRTLVPFMEKDRYLHDDLQLILNHMESFHHFADVALKKPDGK